MTAKDEYFLETSSSKRIIVCLLDVFVSISTIRYLFFIARCENMFHNREVRKKSSNGGQKMKTVILAEKPSQAKAYAETFQQRKRHDMKGIMKSAIHCLLVK